MNKPSKGTQGSEKGCSGTGWADIAAKRTYDLGRIAGSLAIRFMEDWLRDKPNRDLSIRVLNTGDFELLVHWNGQHKFYKAATIEQLFEMAEADSEL